MTGHNHHPGCPCGWCIGGWRSHPTLAPGLAPRLATGTPPQWEPSREGYLVPNALCPLCTATVFFYRSPHGGRVFFDALGPPWPKHPCTDNPSAGRSTDGGAPPLPPPRRMRAGMLWPWEQKNWIPIAIEKVERSGEWSLVSARRLDNGKIFTRAAPWQPALIVNTPAFVAWPGDRGNGRIAWLHSHPGGHEPHEDILMHRTAAAAPVEGVRAALGGDLDWARAMVRASGEAWGKVNPLTQRAHYPDFVSDRVVSAWQAYADDLTRKQQAAEAARRRALQQRPIARPRSGR